MYTRILSTVATPLARLQRLNPRFPNEAVEKLLEGSSKPVFWGHSTLPDVTKVEYSAIGEVDFCALRFRFLKLSFSTASTVKLRGTALLRWLC